MTEASTLALIPGTVEALRHPAPFTYLLGDHEAHLHVECSEDGPTLQKITIVGSTPSGVKTEDVQAVPVAQLVRGAAWRSLIKPHTDERYMPPTPTTIGDRDRLEVAAEVYTVAAWIGDAPRLAVQEALGVSRATATRRIAEAREAGLIDISPPHAGRGGRIDL